MNQTIPTNTSHAKKLYGKSSYSNIVEDFLEKCGILENGQNFAELAYKVVKRISGINDASLQLLDAMHRGDFLPQTTILQNANRFPVNPLTACAVPQIDLQSDFNVIAAIVDTYHQQGMGTGFNLNATENPVDVLRRLNEIALAGTHSGKEARPTANMAILGIDHPEIMQFITAKLIEDRAWKFNLSVDVDEAFMTAVTNGIPYRLRNGKKINATELLDQMADIARQTGEPGIIYLERFNARNTVPQMGAYHSVAPCGEVAMIPGETCQFGYVNLGNFAKNGTIDYQRLEHILHLAVRFLDDALDYSIVRYKNAESARIIQAKRKIAVGVCGWQDLLVALDLPYDSPQAMELARDVMSFINFNSKRASVDLALTRGSFDAFHDARTVYHHEHITRLFGSKDSNTVAKRDWQWLQERISKCGLRNCTTTALPPTGKSSLIIGASAQIEPYFSLIQGPYAQKDSPIVTALRKHLRTAQINEKRIIQLINRIQKQGSLQKISDIPDNLRRLLKTATELSPKAHLQMLAAFQEYNDEGVSKTVNLPANSSTAQIRSVFDASFHLGLLGITVYVDKSRKGQPRKL